MTPGRWAQICAALDKALEQPEAERAEFLARSYPDDSDLQTAVLSLLKADTGAVHQLEQIVAGLAEQPRPIFKPGDRLGGWEIEKLHALGGMSQIYRANRVEGDYKRQVAIKVLSSPALNPDGPDRIQKELQILAQLEHSHIARLYQDGLTTDGYRFLVMEFIEGSHFGRFCEENSLPLRQRLELFIKICGAVQFAHNHFVVHRDLKPGNILIDGSGEPKLLDFGVARMLVSDVEEEPREYDAARSMTLIYTSPEEISDGLLSTGTDIYSLGVLLYHLLAGRVPFESKPGEEERLKASIRHEEPLPPSTVVARTRASQAQDRGNLKQAPLWTARDLRGDLDAITLKALSKNPLDRYPSAEALANDLRNYLTLRPVEAHPQGTRYAVVKALRRNRTLVVAAVALLALTSTAAIFFRVQSVKAERDRLQAEQVSQFMVNVFEAANPDVVQGKEPTASQLLDAARQRISSDPDLDTKLRSQLLFSMAQSYSGLGNHQEARDLYEEVFELRSELYGREHSATAEALALLAEQENNLAHIEVAEEHLVEVLRIWEELKGPSSLESTAPQHTLGIIRRKQGAYAEATEMHRRALRIRRVHLPPTDPLLAVSLANLAAALRYEKKYKEAIPLAREALEVDRAAQGDSHPNVFASLSELAVLTRKAGKVEEAEALFLETLALGERIYPNGHPHYATVLHNYALLEARRGHDAEAETLFRRSLAMDREWRGERHPYLSATLSSLSTSLLALGRPNEAREALTEALDIGREHYGDYHPRVLELQSKFANLLWETGKREAAASLFEEVAKKRLEISGPDSPSIATDLHNLAFRQEMTGDLEAAERNCREALERDRRIFPPDHFNVLRSTQRLASILEGLDQHEGCEELSRELLKYLPDQLPEDHWRLAAARSVLGGCLAGQGSHEEAEGLLRESYEFLKEDRGEEAWQTKGAARRLVALGEISRIPAVDP